MDQADGLLSSDGHRIELDPKLPRFESLRLALSWLYDQGSYETFEVDMNLSQTGPDSACAAVEEVHVLRFCPDLF